LQAVEEGTVKKWIKSAGKALDCKGKRLFMPMRIALTGQMAGPDVAELLHTLHKAEEGEILVDGYKPLEKRIAALKEWLASC
jgi:glutamyl-tRNA synthetase